MKALKTFCLKLDNPAGRTALAKRLIGLSLRTCGMSRTKTNRFISKLWTAINHG
jgi:hypothetical protein